ncbi:MAG: acetoacetate--CoA ligase [Candidatus Latescibacteria bacterium]|nr:acetoacetate--CoA ligase [bacterium]MBD3424511.1 acetoacetate--CoA ligase [Candidatus Latescibacterota bacterium]
MSRMMWKPSSERIAESNMYNFMQYINRRHNQEFEEYHQLWKWSVDNIPRLWESLWDYLDIIHSAPYREILTGEDRMPGAEWFPGARLNFAENLLRYRDDRPAIIARAEDGSTREITYRQLYRRVAELAGAMREMGVEEGDRVVGFMPNIPETIIAMLASASIGALWSSCSPDFGIQGVLDRFGQIEPKLIFTADGYTYKGKKFNSLDEIAGILKKLGSIERVVVVPYIGEDPDLSGIEKGILWNDFISDNTEVEFRQLPFRHPLYIMYSSGTTGLPKCMVQSAGGILIHHMKELALHTDLKREDRIFYFTTCGWMMWNWLTSSLALGATVILFDGAPFHPRPGALFEMAQDLKVTIFGTSAKYLAALNKSGVKPAEIYDLSSLKAILSTGSPLHGSEFDFVYRDIKEDLCLSSISGGTDLNGCFAAGNPMGPVYRGELQCRTLGMNVRAFDREGNSVENQQGELVCTSPFPSMPVYFWNDPEGKKYNSAYFDVYPGVWRHGDFIEITENNGVIFYGRSDATLNPSGVRIGTAEIYRQMDRVEGVEDSLVIGQQWKGDERVILFVKLAEGLRLDDRLKKKIREVIRENTSPRHIPRKIIQVEDIPYTINMKKVEIAVKNIVHGKEVRNQDALRNPESLDLYREIPELRTD